jgi:hypothetical protein
LNGQRGTYFDAGVRRRHPHPFEPKEVARLIPEVMPNTTRSCIELGGARRESSTPAAPLPTGGVDVPAGDCLSAELTSCAA